MHRLGVLFGDRDLMSPFLAPCAGKDGVFRDTHVARDLPQSNARSVGGFDLLPRFDGYLTAHVRLNLTTSRPIAKPSYRAPEKCGARVVQKSSEVFLPRDHRGNAGNWYLSLPAAARPVRLRASGQTTKNPHPRTNVTCLLAACLACAPAALAVDPPPDGD